MATKTKERPIIFSGSMVRAILEGRKTMTRRVVTKPHARKIGLDIVGDDYVVDYCEWNGKLAEGDNWSPYGVPGDRLWVRETWRLGDAFASIKLPYFDDDDEMLSEYLHYRADDYDGEADGQYRSPIHMPRWASRITFPLTGPPEKGIHYEKR